MNQCTVHVMVCFILITVIITLTTITIIGHVGGCEGKGPGRNNDNFESLKIIGNLQFEKAKHLYANATRKLSGPIQYRHTFVPFTNITVDAKYTGDGKTGKTCQAALGYSFLAGTTGMLQV